jgi:phage tail sheath protein FI
MTTTALPGFRVVDAGVPPVEEGLRNDVAAFLGSTVRGPVGVPGRVASRQAFVAAYGELTSGTVPRAVAAYYANGGEVAWVVRTGHGGTAATGAVTLLDTPGAATPALRGDLPGMRVRVTATSPGTWANGSVVRLTYRAFGITGAAEFDVAVEVPRLTALRRAGVAAADLPTAVAARALVTLSFEGAPVAGDPNATGPAVRTWEFRLQGGEEPVLDAAALRNAIEAQADVEEIALVCVPGLARLLTEQDQADIVAELAASCAASQDRLAIVSAAETDAGSFAAWRERMTTAVSDPAQQRAVAAYFPWLLAEDLAGTGPDRYPPTDPLGHVSGVIARLDRERGSGWSPANILVSDAVDTAVPLPPSVQAAVLDGGANLLRARVGGGLEIWGAHTLDPGDGRYLAHRRLVHRIVRAVRRVLEPLAFDPNTQLLWFSVSRAVSGILMEAFRSGALRGETPDEAYRVRCDETTNPPDAIDDGRVVCLVEVAPATPMEFITLRLTLGADGLLEVVEQ